MRLLITIRDEDNLVGKDWLHFLGMGTPEVGCVLTSIQLALRDTGFPGLKVTFDTSTPFSVLGLNKSVCAGTKFSPNGASLQFGRMSDTRAYVGSQRRFPFDSAIGRLLTLGDICVNGAVFQNTTWDALSQHMLANHNLDFTLAGIDQVLCIYDLETRDAPQFLPAWLLQVKQIIPLVFASQTPMQVISRNRRYLTVLA